MWSWALWDASRFDSCNAARYSKFTIRGAMKKSDVWEKDFKGKWIAFGYSFRGIRVGLSLSKYEFTIDLFVVYFCVEF